MINLNSFSGKLPISSCLFVLVGIYRVRLPAEYFSAFSSCLSCWVWGGHSVGWKSVVPLYCGGFSLWVDKIAVEFLSVRPRPFALDAVMFIELNIAEII